MSEFQTAQELRDHYKAVRDRTSSWAAPVKTLAAPSPAQKKPKLTISWKPSTIDPPPTPLKFPRTKTIQQIVMDAYDVTLVELCGEQRHKALVWPRQIAMYLCKKLTPHSLPEVGRRFGGRDHTTVLHAVRKITALRSADSNLDAELKGYEAELAVEKSV